MIPKQNKSLRVHGDIFHHEGFFSSSASCDERVVTRLRPKD
jgi:hypothetical protein